MIYGPGYRPGYCNSLFIVDFALWVDKTLILSFTYRRIKVPALGVFCWLETQIRAMQYRFG